MVSAKASIGTGANANTHAAAGISGVACGAKWEQEQELAKRCIVASAVQRVIAIPHSHSCAHSRWDRADGPGGPGGPGHSCEHSRWDREARTGTNTGGGRGSSTTHGGRQFNFTSRSRRRRSGCGCGISKCMTESSRKGSRGSQSRIWEGLPSIFATSFTSARLCGIRSCCIAVTVGIFFTCAGATPSHLRL